MSRDPNVERRIELAEALLTSAEHSSEAEIRNSLSRMYYAIYHLATAAVGSMAHGEFAASLDQIESGLGARFKRSFTVFAIFAMSMPIRTKSR